MFLSNYTSSLGEDYTVYLYVKKLLVSIKLIYSFTRLLLLIHIPV
jgi:hypothetical protein